MKREIKNFIGEEALVIEGNQLARRKMYDSPSPFKIVSYNALNNDVKLSGSIRSDMVIMDEVQRLKNWDTQIARAARRVISDYTVVLSGTPLENKLEELYSIVQLVDQFILGPYYLFRDRHIITSPSGKVTGYKDLNALADILSPILIRRQKKEVSLQLPGRIDKNLFVPMTKEQMDLHNEFNETVARLVYKWQRAHYLSETDRKRLLLTLSQMRMVCDSSFILDQKTRFDTKVDETTSILEEIFLNGDDKVVIFSGWERMTRLIAMELDKKGIGYSNLNGSVPSPKRKDLIERFNDDPSIRVFLSTDAGATGLNLQTASYVINLDLPWNPAVLEQRIGRIYRIGQARKIQVINLISIGTIEERMLSNLKFKTDLFDGVLNGGEDSVFLDDNKLETIVKDLGYVDSEEISSENPVAETVGHEDIEPTKDAHPDSFEAGDIETGVLEEGYGMTEDNLRSDPPSPPELISQGTQFFGSLLRTLRDPQATEALVDSIVKEDPQTGKTSINIPISGKQAVLDLAKLLGNLL